MQPTYNAMECDTAHRHLRIQWCGLHSTLHMVIIKSMVTGPTAACGSGLVVLQLLWHRTGEGNHANSLSHKFSGMHVDSKDRGWTLIKNCQHACL